MPASHERSIRRGATRDQVRRGAPFALCLALASAPAAAQQAGSCPAGANIDPDRSIVVHDAVLDDGAVSASGAFSFRATIDALLKSGETAATDAEADALVTSMIRSFRRSDATNPLSSVVMHLDPAKGEERLDPRVLLNPAAETGMIPVGLFNRLDLAPSDWKYCGEHRIVYAMKIPPGQTPITASRMTLIFEAMVPNPNPALGAEGCRPVAEFWASLSGIADVPERRRRLSAFFYAGDTNGDGAPDLTRPVIHMGNLGQGERGQVRGNFFVNNPEPGGSKQWHLREWRLQPSPTSLAPEFVMEPVKDNPLAEYYADQLPGRPPGDPAQGEAARFQGELLKFYVVNLMHLQLNDREERFKQKGMSDDILTFNGVALGGENRYNEFQSVSQGTSDHVDLIAGPSLRAMLAARVAHLQAGQPQNTTTLDQNHVLARAFAVTCAGCHQPTTTGLPGADRLTVAPGVMWPDSLAFVHIDEGRTLSPALRDAFIPFRKAVLEDAICRTGARPFVVQRQTSPTLAGVAALRAEPSRERRLEVSAQQERIISEAREEDQRIPGAFMSVRRPH